MTALVVDPIEASLTAATSALALAGFKIAAADTFHEGKRLLSAAPTVLVTALRLGEYNGLHLVMRAKSEFARMAAVVTASALDPVLLAEADALNATFVVSPLAPEQLIAAVLRTISRPDNASEPIREPFERRCRERRLATPATPLNADRRIRDRRRDWLPIF